MFHLFFNFCTLFYLELGQISFLVCNVSQGKKRNYFFFHVWLSQIPKKFKCDVCSKRRALNMIVWQINRYQREVSLFAMFLRFYFKFCTLFYLESGQISFLICNISSFFFFFFFSRLYFILSWVGTNKFPRLQCFTGLKERGWPLYSRYNKSSHD